jgi:hypothetical protein
MIDSDYDNCIAFKKQMIENKMQFMNELTGTSSSSNLNSSSSSSPRTGSNLKLPKTISKKPSVPSRLPTQKATKPPSSTKQSVEVRPQSSYETEDQRENDNTFNNISSDVCVSPLSLTTNLNEKNKTQTTFDNSFDASIIITDDNENENDVFIDKINQLSGRVNQQAQVIKDRDNELKRLRSTMTGKSC